MRQLPLTVEHVDRHDDDAEARGGEEEVEILKAVGEIQREPIAARQPADRERRRHPVRALVEIGERVLLARPLQRHLVRPVAEGGCEQAGQRHVGECSVRIRT